MIPSNSDLIAHFVNDLPGHVLISGYSISRSFDFTSPYIKPAAQTRKTDYSSALIAIRFEVTKLHFLYRFGASVFQQKRYTVWIPSILI